MLKSTIPLVVARPSRLLITECGRVTASAVALEHRLWRALPTLALARDRRRKRTPVRCATATHTMPSLPVRAAGAYRATSPVRRAVTFRAPRRAVGMSLPLPAGPGIREGRQLQLSRQGCGGQRPSQVRSAAPCRVAPFQGTPHQLRKRFRCSTCSRDQRFRALRDRPPPSDSKARVAIAFIAARARDLVPHPSVPTVQLSTAEPDHHPGKTRASPIRSVPEARGNTSTAA